MKIAPALNKKFGYKSVMQIPKLDKVVINVACGEAKDNEKILEAVMKDLGQITGQKAVVCRAKKSVANFKLRQGTPIGCKVTLRGERMYEFVDRFFNIALPRVRDFRGINGNGFDGRGNFACGIKEQIRSNKTAIYAVRREDLRPLPARNKVVHLLAKLIDFRHTHLLAIDNLL